MICWIDFVFLLSYSFKFVMCFFQQFHNLALYRCNSCYGNPELQQRKQSHRYPWPSRLWGQWGTPSAARSSSGCACPRPCPFSSSQPRSSGWGTSKRSLSTAKRYLHHPARRRVRGVISRGGGRGHLRCVAPLRISHLLLLDEPSWLELARPYPPN